MLPEVLVFVAPKPAGLGAPKALAVLPKPPVPVVVSMRFLKAEESVFPSDVEQERFRRDS
jgi:hypothetical protein